MPKNKRTLIRPDNTDYKNLSFLLYTSQFHLQFTNFYKLILPRSAASSDRKFKNRRRIRKEGSRRARRNVVGRTCRHARPDHLEDNAAALFLPVRGIVQNLHVCLSPPLRNGTPRGTRKRGTREKHPNELQGT